MIWPGILVAATFAVLVLAMAAGMIWHGRRLSSAPRARVQGLLLKALGGCSPRISVPARAEGFYQVSRVHVEDS